MKNIICIIVCTVCLFWTTSCDSQPKIKYGYINQKGELVIQPKYKTDELPSDFNDGLALVKIKGKYGYIDKKGNIAIKPVFDEARDFSEGMAAVRKFKEGWGYVNKYGEMVVDC